LTMMELRERVEGWTIENCGFQSGSGVLRVSMIGDCERRIYERMMGREGGVFRALALYEAGMHKRDMVGRLEELGV